MTGRETSCGKYYPQKIEHVWIYNNFIEQIGLDAIQLGSCIAGGRIYENFCVDYGTLGDGGMSNGIQIGLGNIGTICEQNFIRQPAERSENAGHGILCQAAGNNCIRNNIIYSTLENAIYTAEQMAYTGGENAIGHQFIDDIIEDLTGVSIIHNTLMYPARAVVPNAAPFGIRAVYFANRNPPTGGAIINNLIFGTSENNGVNIAPNLMINCNDNQIMSLDWKTVRDQYLDSSGDYDIPNDVPYTAAMEAYFTAPAISEEDNFFRSPTDFYPVHPDIINNTMDECTGTCDSGEDFFGTARSVSVGCANDYGAVELSFPVFTISEDCEGGTFTIHPADQAGTFNWTFAGVNSNAVNPSFATPGIGVYSLTYDYVSADGCIDVEGVIDIELTCSCPCEDTSVTSLNIDGGEGTSWQETELVDHVDFQAGNELDLSNYCLNIRGRLLIDDYMNSGLEIDLYLKNGFIRMQPGAEIIVQAGGGLRIEEVNKAEGEIGIGIHGCDHMWEGIDVEAGGRLIVENSTIQDANTAIGITGEAHISIRHNRFENNYRGIDVAPLIDLTANNDPAPFSLIADPTGLWGNYFGTVGNGLKGTLDPTYIPAGTRGSVGLKTSYLDFVAGFYLAMGQNTFENLQYGIYSNKGTLLIAESTFREVDYGARLYDTPATFVNNSFEDVALRGIESLDAAMLWAFRNEMENMHQRGINYEGATHLTSYMLVDNEIAAQDHCINIEVSPATTLLSIRDNNLSLLPSSAESEVFPDRAALRVFNIGNPTLDIPTAKIKDHFADASNNRSPITINGYGQGLVLENMNNIELLDNEIVYQHPGDELIPSDGIRLTNSPDNYLSGNAVQAVGDFPTVRNFFLEGSSNNEFYCNSTEGGGIGVGFFGTCNNTELNTTTIGNHDIGIRCDIGTLIGLQEHRGNTWPTNLNPEVKASEHQGTEFFVNESIFRLEGSPGSSEFWPDGNLISTPNAANAQWFIPWPGSANACEDSNGSLPTPSDDQLEGKESDPRVIEGDYVTGDYAVVHNWEAGLELFDRLEKNESLRNSESWYQNFYAQANNNTLGDYVRAREDAKIQLSPSDQTRQSADALQASIQDNLEILHNIREVYSQASTPTDSIELDADRLEEYTKLSANLTDWQQLAADVHQHTASNIAALQQDNASLLENIVPAANEKFLNTIQLKRLTGEELTEEQGSRLATLAFSCPLEAGNVVYRARTLLRTQDNYLFDDAAICQLGKKDDEEDGKKSKISHVEISTPEQQWHVYPNPAKYQLWIAGSQLEELQSIELFDGLGISVLRRPNKGNTRMEIQLPFDLPTGIYFLRLQLNNGETNTQKILIQP